jgi:hypothetical protein
VDGESGTFGFSDWIPNNRALFCVSAAVHFFFVHIVNIQLLQGFFKLRRRDSSRDGDVEMGMHQPDASANLKGFLKKVVLQRIL